MDTSDASTIALVAAAIVAAIGAYVDNDLAGKLLAVVTGLIALGLLLA